ncbi:hypothetical protein [Nocardia sp. CA-119907]|uniref:hypothetical protein n=1 Tax=Nocardia sp. CA-119907 TaxID=3239973 RepID=UPI003D984B32
MTRKRTQPAPMFKVTVVNAIHQDVDGYGDRWVATLDHENMRVDWIVAAVAKDARTVRVWCDDCGASVHLCPEIREHLPADVRKALAAAWEHYHPTYHA